MSQPKRPTEQERFFDRSHLKDDLKSHSVRGGAYAMVGQIAVQATQLAAMIILCRLVKPDDYGLVAMIMPVVGFVMIFNDFGLATATVQREKITHNQASTLFWINVSVSLAVTIVVVCLGPVIAWFFDEPLLSRLTFVTAAGIIVEGLALEHRALLQRQMRLGIITVLNVSRALVGACVGVCLAWLDKGVWSLVFMPLAGTIFFAVAVWVACPWRPGMPRRNVGIGSMVAFGGNLTAFHVVNYLSRNVDSVLIGKCWGKEQLGYYNRAYTLMRMPTLLISMSIAATAVPTLSLLQDDPERYKRFFLKLVHLIAFVTMPITMFLIVMAKQVIFVVAGEQWGQSVDVFFMLGIAAMIQPVIVTTSWAYISRGLTMRMFAWEIVAATATIVAFVIGLPGGPVGVAKAYAVCCLLLALPSMWCSLRGSSVKMSGVGKAIWEPLAASCACGGLMMIFREISNEMSAGMILGVGFVGMIVCYLVISCVFARSFRPVTQLIDLANEFRRQDG